MVYKAYDLSDRLCDTYSRISDDPLDTLRGVTRQRADGAEAVAHFGGTLGVEHVENDTSAYRKRRVRVTDTSGNEYDAWRVIRPLWSEALHRLRTGLADALVVYDLDRLARDPRDLEDAIEVVEHYGKTILSATASEIDLTTESGRMAARMLVVMANKSSADTSRRVKRAALETAMSGKPVGWRTFGWQSNKIDLDPTESAIALAAVDAILSRERAVGTIANDWNQAGVLTVQGRQWKQNTLRQYLLNPRLAGFRTYRDELLTDEAGAPVMGTWTPLLDVPTWERLRATLTSRPDARGRIPRKTSRQFLLTAILRCGVCGGPMYGNRQGDRHYYRCIEHRSGERKHTNSIAGQQVDRMITRLVLAKASAIRGQVPEQPFAGEEELADLERMIGELMDAYNAGQISGPRVFPQVGQHEKRIAELSRERDVWLAGRGPDLRDQDVEAKWNAPDTTLAWKRAVVEKAFSAILVKPRTSQGGNRFEAERIDPVPRQI